MTKKEATIIFSRAYSLFLLAIRYKLIHYNLAY